MVSEEGRFSGAEFRVILSAPIVTAANINPNKISKFNVSGFYRKFKGEINGNGWDFTREYSSDSDRMKFEADSYAGTPMVEQPILKSSISALDDTDYDNDALSISVDRAELQFFYFGL